MKKTVQYIIDVAGNASDMLGKIGREAASLGEGKLQWSFPIAIAENGTPRGAGGA